MEDKIKALIEKYEGEIEKVKTSNLFSFGDGLKDAFEIARDDLKQLLPTSQGNPERMV